MNKKSIPGAVLLLVGSVFFVIVALTSSACAEVVDAVGGETKHTYFAYIFGLGGAALAVIAAVLCFNKAVVGGVLGLVSLGLGIGMEIYFGFGALGIISLILVGAGSVLAFVIQKE